MYTYTKKMRIGQKIKLLRGEKGLNQKELAALIRKIPGLENYSYQKVGHIEQGRRKRVFDIEVDALSKVLFVTRDYLLDNSKEKLTNGDRLPQRVEPRGVAEETTEYDATTGIPVIGHVKAGQADIVFDDAGLPVGGALEYLIPPEEIKDANAYGLIVKGDSMSPHFKDGTRIIVSREKEIYNNDLVVCILYSGEAYFKRAELKDNIVTLKSDNPAEDTISIERKNIRFLDKVVWVKMP